MRRILILTISGIILINLVGISITFINFFNLEKEIKQALTINKSLLVRTEVFEKSLSLLNEMKEGRKNYAKRSASEIVMDFSSCYSCHHRSETLSRITAAQELFKTASSSLEKGKDISSGDMEILIRGFITYAFGKAKQSVSEHTQSLELNLAWIKRSVAATIGLTITVFFIFFLYIFRRGTSLEKDVIEKEKVITDWALAWQDTFDAMQDMVILLDKDYNPSVFNSKAAEFFKDSLLRKDFLKFLHIDPSELGNPISRTLEIGDAVFSIRGYPINEAEKRYILVLRDITQERDLQERLNRAEKLASLGLMSGGVAHEINNPLSPIIGYTELLYMEETDQKKKDLMKIILSSAERIHKIVMDLLLFAKERSIKPSLVRIDETIENSIRALKETYSLKDIKIVKKLDCSDTVNIDPSLFEIAIQNILKNAAQAIEESGKGDTIEVRTAKEKGLVRIEISDNGPGIPRDLLPHIFDPFFTTKKVGSGTGLGLSIVYSIIKAHYGDITVQSREGEGTTFIITIPERLESSTKV